TGTSYLLLDDAAVTAYWGQIPGAHVDESQGGWVYNCSITLPPIVVQLQNYGAEISGDLLNYQTRGNGLCLGALQSSVGLQHMILGDVFFKAHYVVFSLASPGPQLGLAPHTAGAGQAADNVANATVVDAPVPGASQ
ncbi:MAG: Type I transmembrane sorting receptor, partial [Thelocarpon superellum]